MGRRRPVHTTTRARHLRAGALQSMPPSKRRVRTSRGRMDEPRGRMPSHTQSKELLRIEAVPEAPSMKTCALLLSLLLTLVGRPAWAEDAIVTGPDRRHEIDLRIEALDAERDEISTDGPKAGTYLGLITGAVGAVTFGLGLERGICDQGCRGGYSQAAMWSGAALMGVGFLTTLISGTIWANRAHRRNQIDAKRELLIEERDGLAAPLSRVELRSPYRDGTQFVTLGVRF